MRDAYYDQLDAVIDELVTMTHEVGDAVQQATRALLEADAEIAEQVISHDAHIDSERERIEELSFELLALQQPVAGDLRMLVAALRMVSDLERMGDLSVHVAKIARLRVPESAVPDAMLPTVKRMAEVAEEMVRKVEDVMTKQVVSVQEDTDLADLVDLMEKNDIKRVPVMRGKTPVGIVTRSNLLQAVASLLHEIPDPTADDEHVRFALVGRLATDGNECCHEQACRSTGAANYRRPHSGCLVIRWRSANLWI